MLILPSKDGLVWGPPRNVTASIKASGKIRVMFGMVNGIELRSGPHPHRIVVPGWALLNRVGATGHYDVSGTALMCKHPQRSPLVLALGAHAGRLWLPDSDSFGDSWEVSQVLTKGTIENTQPSESTVVELHNGSLLVNMRDSLNVLDGRDPSRCGCRLLARSDDGGQTFAAVWQEPELWGSGVEGHMVRVAPEKAAGLGSGADTGVIYFVDPRSKKDRVNGTVFWSADEGSPGSWQLGGRVPGQVWKAAAGRPADTFNYGYGMLAALPSRPGAQAFGVLYRERRHDFFSRALALTVALAAQRMAGSPMPRRTTRSTATTRAASPPRRTQRRPCAGCSLAGSSCRCPRCEGCAKALAPMQSACAYQYTRHPCIALHVRRRDHGPRR